LELHEKKLNIFLNYKSYYKNLKESQEILSSQLPAQKYQKPYFGVIVRDQICIINLHFYLFFHKILKFFKALIFFEIDHYFIYNSCANKGSIKFDVKDVKSNFFLNLF
jgi:hypothetical protein